MEGNKFMRSHSATRGMSKGLGALTRLPFKGEAGFLATFGLGMSALTYDSTKNSLTEHMGRSMAELGAGSVVDTILFNTIGRAGPLGTAAAFGLSMASSALIEHGVGSILKQRNRERGVRPVTQNENTMRATQQAMSLLGQSGRTSMLGQEASYMHN